MSPYIISTLTFSLCTTLSPITRSTRNEKYKGGRRRTTNLNYPKLQNGDENTLKHCISSALETPRGNYRHQEKGGQGTNPGPKYRPGRACTAAETRPGPRFCGPTRAAHARPPTASGHVCPPVRWIFWFVNLMP